MRVVMLALVVLSGCATTANYKRNCDSFIWAPESKLVEKWGIPDGSYDAGGGIKFFKYKRQRSEAIAFTNPGTKFSAPTTTVSSYDLTCETVFKITNGFVESYEFKGDDCVSE